MGRSRQEAQERHTQTSRIIQIRSPTRVSIWISLSPRVSLHFVQRGFKRVELVDSFRSFLDFFFFSVCVLWFVHLCLWFFLFFLFFLFFSLPFSLVLCWEVYVMLCGVFSFPRSVWTLRAVPVSAFICFYSSFSLCS